MALNSYLYIFLVSLSVGSSLFFIDMFGVKLQIIDIYVILSLSASILFFRKFKKKQSLLFYLCITYFLTLILSSFYGFFRTSNPSDLILGFRFGIILFFMIIFVCEKVDHKFNLNMFFLKTLCFWSLFSLIYGVLQLCEFYSIIEYGTLPHHYLLTEHTEDFKEDWGRASALFKGPNELGWFGILAACFLLPKVINGDLKYFIFLISSLSLPFISNSRSAIASLSIILIFTLLLQAYYLTKRRVSYDILKSILLFFMLLVLLFVLGFLFSDFLKFERLYSAISAVFFGGNDSSLSERYRLWNAAYLHWIQHPILGVGGDTSEYAEVIDSGWLSYLLRGGVVLFFAYIIFLLGLLYSSCKIYLKNQSDSSLSILIFTLCMIFANFFISIQHFIYIFIFIAFAVRNTFYETK